MSRECKLDEDMMSKQRDQLAEATQKVIQSFPFSVSDPSHFDVDPDPDPGIHIW